MKIKKKEAQVLPHEQHIDFATPILFKEECLKCHTTSNINDVAAVTLIEHPILDLRISLKEILTMVSILFILIICVFFSMWYHFLRKYFIQPINTLIKQIDNNISHKDLKHKIVIDTNIKEIIHLEKVFNKKNKELLHSYNKLENASNTDSLTGIYNRKKFEEYSSLILNDAKRYKHSFSLVLIDLNKFKPINDTYGHDVGDAVLIFFSRTILENIRETDYLFRIGGDEFILLLNNTSFEEAQIIIKKVEQKLEENLFIQESIQIQIGASFGIVQYTQSDDTIDSLIKIADQRMYENKKSKHAKK
jgi:c-di-GMP phosphodiesterase